ncbi:MAG: S-adenosyl-l-methionine hydroxide adenosyltransferase family protein [Candidatus Bathyarchaeota archaeon]|nr:S-adenosyl-l-methionine hydroxide adenosyltransferase family protein [Candidatus Bathyarchaeota archaeon]
MPKIVTLTTDFGLRDPYVAEMKAAILSISPDAAIVDVTHEVAQFNIRMGAYVLASAAPYFPKGAIHVAVVDPGVGTRRRPILIQTSHSFFVGPDNGLLVLAAEQQGIKCVREIGNIWLVLPRISDTFHGRDVFAPVAAHLANGIAPEEFGSEIHDFIKPEFAEVTLSNGAISGEVLHVDNFGNIITNVRANELAGIGRANVVDVELSDRKLRLKFCRVYGEAELQEPLALFGSHGYFEIAVNQGNAAERFRVKPGDKIRLS